VALLAGIVVGLVAFAALYDLVARRRGRYRPARHWEAARRRRRAQRWRPRADLSAPRRTGPAQARGRRRGGEPFDRFDGRPRGGVSGS